MVPGWAGPLLIEIDNVAPVLVPQALVAVTEIVPPFDPAVAEMELDVEEPLQPDGNVQL
jgi:hypothetical protein